MEFLPINWQDGMKVSQNHFIGLENASRSETQDYFSLGLTSYNYGLTIDPVTGRAGFQLEIGGSASDQLTITLHSCFAVTCTGARIHIVANEMEPLTLQKSYQELSEQYRNQSFYVKLQVNSFDRVKHGAYVPGEDPPRRPFTLPSFQLVLSDEVGNDAAPGTASLLTIGKLYLDQGKAVADPAYVPPCTSLLAHADLTDFQVAWLQALSALETDVSTTQQNALAALDRAGEGGARSGLSQEQSTAKTVLQVSRELLYALGELLPSLRLRSKEEAPIFAVERFQKFAYRVRTAYNCLLKDERGLLNNYFNEAVQVRNFLEALDSMINLEYQHEAIDQSLRAIAEMINMLSTLYDPQNGLAARDFTWRKVPTQRIIVKDRGHDTLA